MYGVSARQRGCFLRLGQSCAGTGAAGGRGGGGAVCHAAMAAAAVMVRMAAEKTGVRAARGPSG